MTADVFVGLEPFELVFDLARGGASSVPEREVPAGSGLAGGSDAGGAESPATDGDAAAVGATSALTAGGTLRDGSCSARTLCAGAKSAFGRVRDQA